MMRAPSTRGDDARHPHAPRRRGVRNLRPLHREELVMTAPAATARILVVANRTASTPALLREVRASARAGARFTLLIPPERAHHHGSDWSQEEALRLLGEAAGAEVAGLDCGPDALDTIHRAVDDGRFDEIIISTVPEHLSRWVHHDLRHRVEHLGLPVRVIPPESDTSISEELDQGLPNHWTRVSIPAGGAPAW
jgi:hypothetical protein